MDRRFLMVLGVSLVFAIVVSSVFYQMTSKAGPAKKVENTELADLVIAGRPLSVGLTIKSTDVKVIKVPKNAYPKGAFGKPEDVLDRPVTSNILLEEPILDGRLAPRGSGTGLAPVIPVGMRAVTIRVNDVVGIAGFVLPGMRVDILITGHPPGNPMKITKTVLQNLTVLSAGKTMQTDQSGKPVDAPNVTLLVSPAQAETLTLAGNEGHIQLVLRNGGDQNIEKTDGASTVALYGSHSKMGRIPDPDGGDEPAPRPRRKAAPPPVIMAAPAPLPPPPPAPTPIITIRGTNVQNVQTGNGQKSSEDLGRNP